METTYGSIISQEDGYIKESVLMTYSEEEKQNNEINRDNAQLVFSPKFIQYDPYLARKYKLNLLETLIYGYIDFVLRFPQQKFRVSNEHIGELFGFKDQHISNSIQKLKNVGLLDIGYKMKMSGGKMRYISRSDAEYNHSCIPTITTVVKNKNNINIYNITEFENYDIDKYRNELYIIQKGMDLGIGFNKQELEKWCIRVKDMLSEFIPRREDGKIDWNLAKSYTNARYDYWENPPKGKKKPTNFKTSLRNNIEMRSKPKIWNK